MLLELLDMIVGLPCLVPSDSLLKRVTFSVAIVMPPTLLSPLLHILALSLLIFPIPKYLQWLKLLKFVANIWLVNNGIKCHFHRCYIRFFQFFYGLRLVAGLIKFLTELCTCA